MERMRLDARKCRVLFPNSTRDQGNYAAERPGTQAAAMNKKDLEFRKDKFYITYVLKGIFQKSESPF